jgi:hypothetical protein
LCTDHRHSFIRIWPVFLHALLTLRYLMASHITISKISPASASIRAYSEVSSLLLLLFAVH